MRPPAEHNVSDPGVTLLAGTVEAEAEDLIEIDAYASSRPLAKPPVRALAKQLGVDLARCPAPGRKGSVTRDDLQALRRRPSRRRSPADRRGPSAASARRGCRSRACAS